MNRHSRDTEPIMFRTLAIIAATALLAAGSPHAAIAQERGPAGTVTLSRTDYDRLLDLASKQPRPLRFEGHQLNSPTRFILRA